MQKKSFRNINKEKNKKIYCILMFIFCVLIFAIFTFASWLSSASSDIVVGFKNVDISKYSNYEKEIILDIMILDDKTLAPISKKANGFKSNHNKKLIYVFDVIWEGEITKTIPAKTGFLLVSEKNKYADILNVSIEQGNNTLITNEKKIVKVLVEIELVKSNDDIIYNDIKNEIISIPINFKIEKE